MELGRIVARTVREQVGGEGKSDEGRVKNKGDEAKRREWPLFSSPRPPTLDTAERSGRET
jgi:hypothetical protein